MKDDNDNLHIGHWTDDPAQREDLLLRVDPHIKSISRYVARRHSVEHHGEDIGSGIRTELWQRIMERQDEPFAMDSAKAAAESLIKNYVIFKIAGRLAGKIARQESRLEYTQAEELERVRQPDLRPDLETQAFAIAKGLSLTSVEAKCTKTESEVFCLEGLRRAGVADLPDDVLERVAEAAGISGSKVRAHNQDHKEHGQDPRVRKAWSRACAKITKTFTRAELASFLVIVLALSLALFNAVHQGRSIHQKAFVNQGSFIHQPEFAPQDNLIHQPEFAHQGSFHQPEFAHQGNLIHQPQFAHQGNLVHQPDFERQGLVITNRDQTA